MGMNNWMGFGVGEQLLHQFSDVVQSGNISGYVVQGWLGPIWAYCEAPCVGCRDERRIANKVVRDWLTVGFAGVRSMLESSDFPGQEFVVGDAKVPREAVLVLFVHGHWDTEACRWHVGCCRC